LLVSPHTTRHGLLKLIKREVTAASAGHPASITLKMNSLVDQEMIQALYGASDAGVEVDLVIRGICCLVPGVPGLSERIRVRSIVGRYLEHSRIYRFANGAGIGHAHYLIGSADLMPRNLDRRVEALIPVVDPHLQARLQEILDVNLADDVLAWDLDAAGSWRHVDPTGHNDTHLRLQELAHARTHKRS
jgi:polyphosphate kinase